MLQGRHPVRSLGLIVGPLLAVSFLLLPSLDPHNAATGRMAAIAVWMAVWWITEAVPLPVTALLPVVLFPLLGIMAGRAVAPLFFNSIIFLFLGGFLVALAMERWQLHRRIALHIILAVGGAPQRLVLGFMVATGFLSMWISNTATAMMMIPIAMAVIAKVGEKLPAAQTHRFAGALLLGTAYGASIGGMATLVGTPPNPLLVKTLTLLFPRAPEISFAQWLAFTLPLSVVFLLLCWIILGLFFRLRRLDPAVERSVFLQELAALGPLRREERIVLIDFVLLALLWMTRAPIPLGFWTWPGWSGLLANPSFVDDGTVAIGMALLLFLVPSWQRPGERIMDWATARRLPWGIVLLFGGGFALAQGFVDSGLSAWLGGRLQGLGHLPLPVIVMLVCLLMTFWTELTSNTATTQMALPILAAVAVAVRVNPLLLMVPATLSASCAFMLPVATPPNAIIFGTDMVRSSQMARVGFVLNLLGVFLITLAIWWLGRGALGISLGELPSWAQG